jgi:hypothetical protein
VILRKKVSKILRKKAGWKLLNKKTRPATAKLLTAGMLCLVLSLTCAAGIMYGLPGTEIFQAVGITVATAWITLFSLAFVSDIAGTVITRYETCQRLYPAVQKNMSGFSVIRLSAARAASYRAGHGRAHRSPSRRASKAGSDDGGSDDSDGDSPAPLPLVVVPFFTSLRYFHKSNNFTVTRRFLRVPCPWRMFFGLPCEGRGWGL